MRHSRIMMVLVYLFLLVGLTSCQQSVFVGMAPQVVDQRPLTATASSPIPEFGPLTFSEVRSLTVDPQPAVSLAQQPTPSGPPFAWSNTENILILGTDRRGEEDSWRTDTIMVVGVDRDLERVAVLSIPRDLYVDIPNYGYGRVNQIDHIGEEILSVDGGGPALISDVLSRTLGISTEHWVRFEMAGFTSVVDAVDGVTIHLDCPFYEPIYDLDTNSWRYFTLPAGEVHMDGETAYWYVRLRLRESDIGRARRQRQFLWAIRDQALSANLLLRLPELWSAFRESFTTDLSLLQMIELARFGIAIDPSSVRASGISLRELQSFTTDAGASVLIITDPARVKAVVDGIWDAPTMADSYRHDSTNCAPVPDGVPSLAAESALPLVDSPLPTPEPGGAAAEFDVRQKPEDG